MSGRYDRHHRKPTRRARQRNGRARQSLVDRAAHRRTQLGRAPAKSHKTKGYAG